MLSDNLFVKVFIRINKIVSFNFIGHRPNRKWLYKVRQIISWALFFILLSVQLEKFAKLLHVLRGSSMRFHFFKFIKNFFANRLLNRNVVAVGTATFEVIVQNYIVTDTLTTKILLIHVVENSPFGLIGLFID